jgi:hypothetical protein
VLLLNMLKQFPCTQVATGFLEVGGRAITVSIHRVPHMAIAREHAAGTVALRHHMALDNRRMGTTDGVGLGRMHRLHRRHGHP